MTPLHRRFRVDTRATRRFLVGVLIFSLCLTSALFSTCSKTTVGPKQLTVMFLDVGQGDACLLLLPDGTSMLVDAGTRSAGETVVRSLSESGINKVTYLVFTHPHEDHIGGGVAVLKEFDVGQIYMPRTSHTTKTYEDLLLAIRDKGLSVTEAKTGKAVVDTTDLKALFLGPTKNYEDLNNCSAVLCLTYGEVTFILTGDAESEAEKDMLAAIRVPDVDVLKVGHHGSATSTCDEFLDAVDPEVAVVSVGKDNTYGHPAPSTLDRLDKAGADIYRTDVHGSVTVTTDGRAVEVKTER